MASIRINVKAFFAGILGSGLHYQTNDVLYSSESSVSGASTLNLDIVPHLSQLK